MKTVLSIDGGGIRGIIPAKILEHVERKTRKRTAEMFDLIAGTSTGGILALALAVPDSDDNPAFSADDLAALYEKRGKDIFYRSSYHCLSSIGGLAEEKYPHQNLEAVLHEYFAEYLVQHAITNVMVSAYEIEERSPFFIKSWDGNTWLARMRDAARATSAAPTFFEPARVHFEADVAAALIDGGVYVNNPAMSAYAEARRLWPDERIVVVSLGTGEATRPITYEEARDWGAVGWIAPLISVMMHGQAEAAHYQLRNILRGDFYRIQGRLNIALDDMDNASASNILALGEEARRIAYHHEGNLAEICALLG